MKIEMKTASARSLFLAPLLSLLLGLGCATAPAATEGGDPAAASSKTENSAGSNNSQPQASAEVASAADCAGGMVPDDGSAETGYSFVPSAKWGIYVQRIHTLDLSSRELDQVCVCWLRTRDDGEIDFEVVFFAANPQGRPVAEPYATVAAHAAEVPKGKENAGRLWSVDVSGITVPEGMSFVGVRWDPGADSFFFVCADHSDGDSIHQVYYQDDRSKGSWQDALNTRDPIFRDHRAILVRTLAKEEAAP